MAAYAEEWGTENVRAQFFDGAIKQIAPKLYKFKQAVSEVSTGAWTNFFYRESTDVLEGDATNTIKGIPRGADFPQATVTWERITSTIEKYGLEENIPWEDLISNEIDAKQRTVIKIAEGVIKAVDDEIWDTLTESRLPVNIQSITIGSNGRFWDVASAAIIDDLAQARQLIAEKNYPTNNLMAFISPKDHRSIVKYLTDKGAQFPKVSEGLTDNGVIGKLMGITLVESNSVTASYALVVVPKRVGTWKQLVPLSSATKEDKFKSITVRTVELGTTQLTDPLAAVLIRGTQDPA